MKLEELLIQGVRPYFLAIFHTDRMETMMKRQVAFTSEWTICSCAKEKPLDPITVDSRHVLIRISVVLGRLDLDSGWKRP